MRKRHDRYILIKQDDGNCQRCCFFQDINHDENQCTANHKWKKCTQYVRVDKNIKSEFYRYERLRELSKNIRTI